MFRFFVKLHVPKELSAFGHVYNSICQMALLKAIFYRQSSIIQFQHYPQSLLKLVHIVGYHLPTLQINDRSGFVLQSYYNFLKRNRQEKCNIGSSLFSGLKSIILNKPMRVGVQYCILFSLGIYKFAKQTIFYTSSSKRKVNFFK